MVAMTIFDITWRERPQLMLLMVPLMKMRAQCDSFCFKLLYLHEYGFYIGLWNCIPLQEVKGPQVATGNF
jgi:hypothetical protein